MPYACRVPAAGRLKETVEQDVEDRLASTEKASTVAIGNNIQRPRNPSR
ncbi:hypothetical protein ACC848_41675 [Rhizobium johnstonii]